MSRQSTALITWVEDSIENYSKLLGGQLTQENRIQAVSSRHTLEEVKAVIENIGEDYDFARLQEEVKAWSEYNFPRNKDYFPLMGATEEIGELNHVRLKWEQGIRDYDQERYNTDSEDAIADIIIYLADYCARNGFSMQHAIETVWPQVRARDWRKFPKNGVSE